MYQFLNTSKWMFYAAGRKKDDLKDGYRQRSWTATDSEASWTSKPLPGFPIPQHKSDRSASIALGCVVPKQEAGREDVSNRMYVMDSAKSVSDLAQSSNGLYRAHLPAHHWLYFLINSAASPCGPDSTRCNA
ncbi:hypothetical protein PoB_003815200 [Plakobranchus ocellatus]|uniref:Uncharacterized protein n=1 Tax=Plakobranchus ocellatus TaxID=259542 RepID=A0AAV4AWK1_9GAST|nr:hypothetical protein PoB_003815200 [Plakobranchus ocellatus]